MDQAPAVTEAICVVALDVEAVLGFVLEHGDRVIVAFDEQVDSLRSQSRRIKSVEQNGPATPLSVTDFSRKDGFLCGVAAAVELKVSFAETFDQLGAQCVSRSRQRDLAARI